LCAQALEACPRRQKWRVVSANCSAKSTTERTNNDLKPHELPLLKLLAEGHHYKTAATELHVTPSPINFHLQNI
jgi:DNA-binding NarL/FixJ family response regulator